MVLLHDLRLINGLTQCFSHISPRRWTLLVIRGESFLLLLSEVYHQVWTHIYYTLKGFIDSKGISPSCFESF